MLVHTIKQVEIENAVAEAVFLVFGGIPQAAKALGIVAQGVRNTLSEGKVATRANAERWENATAAAGCKIPREELIGWAPWRGPERHDIGASRLGKGRGRSGRAKTGATGTAAPADAAAVAQALRKSPGSGRNPAWTTDSDERCAA